MFWHRLQSKTPVPLAFARLHRQSVGCDDLAVVLYLFVNTRLGVELITDWLTFTDAQSCAPWIRCWKALDILDRPVCNAVSKVHQGDGIEFA